MTSDVYEVHVMTYRNFLSGDCKYRIEFFIAVILVINFRFVRTRFVLAVAKWVIHLGWVKHKHIDSRVIIISLLEQRCLCVFMYLRFTVKKKKQNRTANSIQKRENERQRKVERIRERERERAKSSTCETTHFQNYYFLFFTTRRVCEQNLSMCGCLDWVQSTLTTVSWFTTKRNNESTTASSEDPSSQRFTISTIWICVVVSNPWSSRK